VPWTRWTGLAAVAVLWSTQAALVVAGEFDLIGERPLSDLALQPGNGFVFGTGLVVAAVLFVTFLTWLRGRYRVGLACSLAMVVGMTGQLVAGVVPIGGAGTSNRVHVTAALILGASIPVLMWRFAAAQPRGAWRRRSYGLFWLEAAACAAGVTLSQNHVAPLAEILPALAFHAWVGVLTFGSPNRPSRGGPFV
jgi:hypothetical membrane protein